MINIKNLKEETMAKMVEISVILPVYNEENNLKILLPLLNEILRYHINSFEIIVIDGGSEDASVVKAKALGARTYIQNNKGFAAAIKEGIQISRGKYIITMDADNSHSPEFVKDLLDVRTEADLVIGSRFVKGALFQTNIWRKFFSLLLNKISCFVFSLPVKDFSSGFRIYRRDAIKDICIESHDFDIQLELLIKIITSGRQVKEIPLIYKKRLYGCSKARVIKYGSSFLKTVFKMYKLKHFKKKGEQ